MKYFILIISILVSQVKGQKNDSVYVLESIPFFDKDGNMTSYIKKYDHLPTKEDSSDFIKNHRKILTKEMKEESLKEFNDIMNEFYRKDSVKSILKTKRTYNKRTKKKY